MQDSQQPQTQNFLKNPAFTIHHLFGRIKAILREAVHHNKGPPAGVKVAEAAGIMRKLVRLICSLMWFRIQIILII